MSAETTVPLSTTAGLADSTILTATSTKVPQVTTSVQDLTTAAAVAGENDLEVEVANTWSNRLTGDAQGAGDQFARTNVPWSKDTPLQPSGLLGPVQILAGEGVRWPAVVEAKR